MPIFFIILSSLLLSKYIINLFLTFFKRKVNNKIEKLYLFLKFSNFLLRHLFKKMTFDYFSAENLTRLHFPKSL